MKFIKSKIITLIFLILNKNLYSFKSFDEYMKASEYFRYEFILNSKQWKIVHNQFESFRKIKIKSSTNPLIPKIIHQIWLGSSLPDKYKDLQKTWIKYHPDWQYKLWTDKEIEELNLENKILYDQTKNFGEKSDIARYEILHKFGGLYVDCDFECLKPFDIFHFDCDFYAGIGHGANPVILCGLFGCIPKHPILKECIKTIKRSEKEKESFKEILNRTSIFHFTKCFFKSYTQKSIIFPTNFFYPLPDWENKNPQPKNFLKLESFAIHYWHLSWNNGIIE